MAPLLVREGVHRDAFLATLGSRTWRPRAYAAAVLADLDAVTDAAAYAGWLRRTATAWACLPEPPTSSEDAWPLVTVRPECLGGQAALAADLAELTADRDGRRHVVPAPRAPGGADEAFLVGAAYVCTVAAGDAAVLTDAALALHGPVGTRFVRWCRELAAGRATVRRELSAWAADRTPDTVERAVLTAQTLMNDLAAALPN